MPPKLHPVLIQSVVTGLISIFADNRYADKVIEYLLKSNPKWGSRDRAFIAETIYDMVRNWRLLWFLSGKEMDLQANSLYQLFGIYWLYKGNSLPNWDIFKQVSIRKSIEMAQKTPAIFHSFPDWLVEMLSEDLGTASLSEIAALNQQAEVVLRVNTLKKNKRELLSLFAQQQIEVVEIPAFADALMLKKRQNIFGNSLFQQGFFDIQDAGSQLIAPFTEVEPGMRVIDACAGAGGKSLHLAALMQNKGRIISMDIAEQKLTELKRRASRAGANIIETRVIEGSKSIKRLADTADRLLLDVPCSGIGVIRRNPDAKWKLSPAFIEEVKVKQSEILQSYSRMLRVGGILTYATCSILSMENSKQVQAFLAQNGNKYELLAEQNVLPSQGFDGFYMAKMKRKA